MENKTKEKYLKALIDLKLAMSYNPKINITGFCKDYGLNTNTAWQLTNGGIVLNRGKQGRGVEYVWNTIIPNIKMAEELINRVNKVSGDAMKKTRGGERPNSGGKTKEYENLLLVSYTTYLFFGLIKITTKLNYNEQLISNHIGTEAFNVRN